MPQSVLGPAGRVEQVVGTVVLRFVGVLLAATALLVLVDPRDPNIVFRRPLVVGGFLLAAVVAALTVLVGVRVRPRRPAGAGRAWWSWVLATALSFGGAAAAVIGARRLAYDAGWDVGVVTSFSETLHASGRLTPYAVDYLSRYPNNVPLLAVMNASRTVADHTGTTMVAVFAVLNGLCMAAAMLATYALVRMLRSHRSALCAQLVLLLLLGASPWMAVPYTDVILMPFVVVGLLLAVAALRARRPVPLLLLTLGSVALLTVGFTVKATVAPALVAVALVGALVVLGRLGARPLVAGAAVALAAGAVFLATSAVAGAAAESVSRVDAARLEPDRQPPSSWWVAMGLSTPRAGDRVFYGSYDGPMVNQSRKLRGEALRAYSDRTLRARLEGLGPLGLAGFMVDKQAFNWGDGMFWAWGEGRDTDPALLLEHDAASRWVQSWNHVSGTAYLTRASVTNGVWLFVLAWAGVGLMGARYRREVLLLALSVLMLTGFTLLLQSRSRYLLAYVPVVVALAAVVDPRSLRPSWRSRRHAAG